MWVKNILGNFCLHCSVSAEVHLEQLRPSLGAVDQKFSDGMAALHGLFHEVCKLPWLTQCWSGLTMGFKDLNSSAICFSSWKISPNISAFSYRTWQCYWLSCVPVSVADTMVPSPCPMARLCTYSLLSFMEFFTYFWAIQQSQLLLPPTLDFLYMSISTGLCPIQQRTVQHFHVRSWDTSASTLAKSWMKFVFLLKAGSFMFPDMHTVNYEDFYLCTSRFFFSM